MREFHVSRQARDRYQFDDTLFSLSGNVIFANFHAARQFAQKLNQKRDLVNYPEQAIRAGQINAMGLIDEIMHLVVNLYDRQASQGVMEKAYAALEKRTGPETLNKVLRQFTAQFPPVRVYRGQASVEEYLAEETDGVPNRAVALEELLMLWVANMNPAFEPFQELFNDQSLGSDTAYRRVIQELRSFFAEQPVFGPDQQPLIEMLRAPAIAVPQSLPGQLEFIRERWGDLLGQHLYRLLSSLDLVKEEERMRFGGPGPIPVPVYDRSSMSGVEEVERFSEDRDWMPRLVMIAKNTYVWLDQLSRKYNRTIRYLSDIPEEELRTLAEWGFSGLWLIGLWERSEASARIKQLGGNEDAIASAYSIAGYQIANELGGELAYQGLREKAWRYGIRLASDMVPNHMGIDSSWVIEHPDWFIALDYSPFPGYSFSGPDLSPVPQVSIFLEDHYFTRTDAAVVFKRVDNQTGQAVYIYHGNDGTSMPWNDTAQLNYLNAAVREAVIQTILDVARRFPIIRFDAAMTLAKKHYQRLWFPEPGSGGAIPSRAEYGMTRADFDRALPEEFWREVVDRVAAEVPDTLLLAEAFWLMEGYFVRTLGMHRVYNSAFMNMLRNEDNANYRLVMKNTLEFDPEIMKRFVNFMNNPDERTAVDQFGKGDKYFGVAVMMSTLPGLPMYGHGQIEGFAEKYGMEFKRPLWEESVDPYLVERHRREIFPILHKRYLFSGMKHFLLYDFFTPEGSVNEDVYAFSNGTDTERALVVYHNRFASTQGWIRLSVGYMQKGAGEERPIVQRSVSEGLNLSPAADRFVIFRDLTCNLEYIRSTQELAERGLFLDLQAYKYHVFTDFREVQDDAGQSFRHLADYLAGRGVPNIQHAMKELLLAPVQEPFRKLVHPGFMQYLLDNRSTSRAETLPDDLLEQSEQRVRSLLAGIESLTGFNRNPEAIATEIQHRMQTVLKLSALQEHFPVPGGKRYQAAVDYLRAGLQENRRAWVTLLAYAYLHNLGKLGGVDGYEARGQSWLEEWQFGRILSGTAEGMGFSGEDAWKIARQVSLLIGQQNWYEDLQDESAQSILRHWLADDEIQRLLGVNRYKDILWFNQEALEEYVWWMTAVAFLSATGADRSASQMTEDLLGADEIAGEILRAARQSEYQVSKLLAALAE
jgi:hypothetical protein